MTDEKLKDVFELSKLIASQVIRKIQLQKFDRKFTKDKEDETSSNDSK